MLRSFVLFLAGVAAVAGVPQRNAPRRGACVEFRSLLADDYTVEEEFQLIEDFKVFLLNKDKALRGKFEDFETGECSIPEFKYSIADPKQCDKYWDCDVKGNLTEKLCPDGSVYDIPGRSCNHPQRVTCGERTLLQEPVDPHPDCPRLNGYFYTPEEDCHSYNECRDGGQQNYACSTGLVYSLDLLSCVYPAQSGRQKCIDEAEEVKSFRCNDGFKTHRGKVSGGSHEKFANTEDCIKFYICVLPRVGGAQIEGSCRDQPNTLYSPKKRKCEPAELVRAEVERCADYEFPE